MSKVKNSILLARCKIKVLQLYKNGQIPFVIADFVEKLTTKDKHCEFKIKVIMPLVENFLRVVGYYHRYPDAERQANEDIKKILDKEVN